MDVRPSTLVIGLLYLAGRERLRHSLRRSGSTSSAALLIGVPLLHWFHTSDFDFAVDPRSSRLFFVRIGYATKRSSWAVFGTIGFFIATIHYVVGSPTALVEGAFGLSGSGVGVQSEGGSGQGRFARRRAGLISPWAPALALGLLGFWLVGPRARSAGGAIAAPADRGAA